VNSADETNSDNNEVRNVSSHQATPLVIKRRAQAILRDRAIDPQTRSLIRYALETDDPWLGRLVKAVDAGESIDEIDFSATPDYQLTQSTGADSAGYRLSESVGVDSPEFQLWLATEDNYSIEEKIEMLTEMICRVDVEARKKSAALVVLMAALEDSTHPKALANIAKHVAFTRCGEMNVSGMIESQVAMFEGELL
jgi:hypothetical protein